MVITTFDSRLNEFLLHSILNNGTWKTRNALRLIKKAMHVIRLNLNVSVS